MNLRYIPDGEGGCTMRDATEPELIAAREAAREKMPNYAFRSCYACNDAHAHLMQDDGFLFTCFSCGKWYYGGIDISTYDDEEPLNVD